MNESLRRVALGHEGIRYLESYLEAPEEAHELSRLLRQLPLADGEAVTYLAADVDIDDLDLADGELWGDARSYMEAAAAILMHLHLKAGGENMAVFEDPVASAGDPWLQREQPVPYGVYENRVYYVLGGDWAELDRCVLALRSVGSYRLVGALTSGRDSSAANRTQVPRSTLESFAANASTIIVNAFDADGHVWWFRSSGAARTAYDSIRSMGRARSGKNNRGAGRSQSPRPAGRMGR